MKIIGILVSLLSAIAYGFGSVLQSRSEQDEKQLPPDSSLWSQCMFTLRSMIQPLFLWGTFCDVIGFGANAVADKIAPLFLVQPIMATNLLFAAIFGIYMLHTTIHFRGWLAIGLVIVGLILLGASASQEGHQSGPAHFDWYVLIASIVLVIIGAACTFMASNTAPRKPIILVSLIAGILFGILAIAVRIAPDTIAFTSLVTSPAIWAIIIAGGGGFYLYAAAIDKGSVTTVLALITIGETVVPAVVGLSLLGDTTIAHLGFLMVIGFVTSIIGIIILVSSPGAIPTTHKE